MISDVINNFLGMPNFIEENKEELKKKDINVIQEPLKIKKIDYNKDLEINFMKDIYKKYGRTELLRTVSEYNHIRHTAGLKTKDYSKEIIEVMGGRVAK